jgi:membrane-associated phospholipid phosphatase
MSLSRRFAWLLLMLAIASLYLPLNYFLTSGYNLKIGLDDYIPILPIFVVPYLLFLPFWVLAFLYAAWKMDDRLFRAFMIASVSAAGVTVLTFALFPTYTARPQISASGWAANLLNLLYSKDKVFNAFPSQHVLYTTVIALFGITWRPAWRWLLGASVVLVVLATLFTGQHHLLDPLGGLALAYGSYRFGLWAERALELRQVFSYDKNAQPVKVKA